MPDTTWVQELRDVVAEDSSVTGSATAMIDGIVTQIEEAVDAVDGAAESEVDLTEVRTLLAQLRANTQALAQSVAAKTPAKAEVPAEPVPIVDAPPVE